MKSCAKRLRVPAISLLLAALVLLPSHVTVKAGNPYGATYCPTDSSRVFWFLHASDLHVGMSDSTDAERLNWLVTTARSIINPSFIVVTGDLTDSTNGNWLGIPNGPYQAEWDEYKGILAAAGAGPDVFYDIPGNHDAYNDATFAYYRANSVQGRFTKSTQVSWTRDFGYGKYHFLGVNSADNSGDPFSIFWPYGDYAGLDSTELAFISSALFAHRDARLTFVFGHHPVTDTLESGDTWLYYGHQQFIQALDSYRASTYNYGHTHSSSQTLFTGNPYTGFMASGGIHYYNVASLGKSSSSNFSVVAVDCDGVTSVTKAVGAWPVVLITAPVDKYIGSALNPYGYTVPASGSNVVRALVFDAGTISQVRYRIDNGTNWYSMSRIAERSPVWEGAWDASALAAGEHTIEVQVVGSATVSDVNRVDVGGGAVNHAPVAANDTYSAFSGQTLTVDGPGVLGNDSDPDGDPLRVTEALKPEHGILTLLEDGSFTYTAGENYAGPDTFTYTASDGKVASNVATVTISVTAPDDVAITSATYNTRKKQLTVQAKSSAAPTAKLTVYTGDGKNWLMKYSTKTKMYTLTVTTSPQPASVTVRSSAGGSATLDVTTR